MSTTNKPNQENALSTEAEHELMGTWIDVHVCIPELSHNYLFLCIVYQMWECADTQGSNAEIFYKQKYVITVFLVFVVYVAEIFLQGKSSVDEDTGLHEIG